jgi:hypothetical protein
MPSYEQCHQPEVKAAMESIEHRLGTEMMKNDSVIKMIKIVEAFLKRKRLICYGGTAINNVLPTALQFYDTTTELPDYDFFSPDPVSDAKELADIYAKHGYEHVRASAGVHAGTFKVHVDYVPVADLTYLDPRLYAAIKSRTIVVKGIHYTPPVYLRMLMHLELSRPEGDVSRWDKVANRLALLDQVYPMHEPGCTAPARQAAVRERDALDARYPALMPKLRSFLAEREVVFAGAFAVDEINHSLRRTRLAPVTAPTQMVVISTEAKKVAEDAKKFVGSMRVAVRMVEFPEIGEVIARHFVLVVDEKPLLIVFEALQCHAFNNIEIKKVNYQVATIDTMLTIYLAFVFIRADLFPHATMICICNDLSRLAMECRGSGRGALGRFDRPCYGDQTTLADLRKGKDRNYKRLKGKNDAESRRQWTYYFMGYEPRKSTAATRPSSAAKAGGRRTRKRRSKGKKSKRSTRRR